MPAGAKGKYNPKRVQIILDCLKEGLPQIVAAHAAGITEETFYKWKKEKSEFSEQLKKVEAECQKTLLQQIKKDQSWQSKAWILERRWKAQWGRHDRLDVEAKVTQVDFEELRRIANATWDPDSEDST